LANPIRETWLYVRLEIGKRGGLATALVVYKNESLDADRGMSHLIHANYSL